MDQTNQLNEWLAAARNGDPERLMSRLSKEDAAKVERVMNDPALVRSLLNSDAAQKLMKQLNGE